MAKRVLSQRDALALFDAAVATLLQHGNIDPRMAKQMRRSLVWANTDAARVKILAPIEKHAAQVEKYARQEAGRILVSQRMRRLDYNEAGQLVGSRWFRLSWLHADWYERIDRVPDALTHVWELVIDARQYIGPETQMFVRLEVVEEVDGKGDWFDSDGRRFSLKPTAEPAVVAAVGKVLLPTTYSDVVVRQLRREVPRHFKWDLTKTPPSHPAARGRQERKNGRVRRMGDPQGARKCCVIRGVTRCAETPMPGSWYCEKHKDRDARTPKSSQS